MKCPNCLHEWKWSKGGEARALKLSSEQRQMIAKKASNSRKRKAQPLESKKVVKPIEVVNRRIGRCMVCQREAELRSTMIQGMKAFVCSDC